MKWLKGMLIGLGLLLAIAVALPFFFSLNDYVPQIEKAVSDKLKEPVTIKSIKLTALPLPHVTVDGITVGTTDDIKIGKVLVTPDLFSLLQSTKVIKSIEIDSLVLTQKALDKIPLWSKPDTARSPTQFRVKIIRLNNVQVNYGKASLGPFDVLVSLDSKGEPERASIATQDSKLKALIKPNQSNYLIDVSATAWQLPVAPPIVFDELSIKGVATLKDANLNQVSARLYGGTANGKATVSWQKGMQLSGNFDVHQVEMQKIAPMLSFKARVSGRLSAKPAFSASAASADQLMNVLHLETAFNVQNGVLHGVDIQKAATSLIKKGATGGETRFDQLSGHLVMDQSGYRFTQLKISSGTLAVDGNVNVSPMNKLSGRVNAHVKAVGANAPLNVTGTVDEPLLYPTAGTVAGAAVGTAIMGPGFGTSVGAKIGGWAEGLFENKEEEKPKK
jgi:uncharacterized protein involved in outer membrane biogenesis